MALCNQAVDPTRKIDPETWAALEESLILSLSSFGLQPWRFYVITNRAPSPCARYDAAHLTSAALLGVDTCPMEGLDPAGYDQALGLKGTGYWTVAACPAGYRAAEGKYSTLAKVRFEKKDVIAYLP